MTFAVLLQPLLHYGPIILFLAVLLEQLGLPVPGAPLLVAGGALCKPGHLGFLSLIPAAVLACLVADASWYWIAKLYLVKQPDRFRLATSRLGIYLRNRRAHFLRYGCLLFLAFKFLPGPNLVSLHLGYFGSGRPRLLLFDTVASLLWAGGYLTVGYVFGAELSRVLAVLAQIGIVPLLAVLALILGMKISGAVRRARTTRLSASVLLPAVPDGASTAPQAGNSEYRSRNFEDGIESIPDRRGESSIADESANRQGTTRDTEAAGSCPVSAARQPRKGRIC